MNLTLPWPPSANRIWRSPRRGKFAGRVLLSREARQYRADVALVARGRAEHARLAVGIRAFPPDRRRRDLDNLCKAALDAMVKAGVIEDDGRIDVLLVSREAVSADHPRLEVTIEDSDKLRGGMFDAR